MIGEPMNFVHLTHIGSGEMGAGDGLAMVTREWGQVHVGLWPGTVPLFESSSRGRSKMLDGEVKSRASLGHRPCQPEPGVSGPSPWLPRLGGEQIVLHRGAGYTCL